MQVEQRLLKYVSYWTTSDENNMTDGKIQIPSTGRQFDLGKVLEQELRDLGLKNVVLTDHCYVYGLLPATAGCEGRKAVGFYLTYGYRTGLLRQRRQTADHSGL